MVSVVAPVEPDELDGLDPQAASPAASRPAAATATSLLELRLLALIFTFPVLGA